MNKFHNDIKRYMINTFTPCNSKVLDLASGRGGDLIKWIKNKNVKSVRGYDMDKDSVKEAKKRLESLNPKKSIRYFVKDLGKTIIKRGKYDVINIQFALHYFFKDFVMFSNLMETIKNTSKKDTVFMFSILDPEYLKEMDTKNISIDFIDIDHGDIFGREIKVWIRDTIISEPSVEYIVDTIYLTKVLLDMGFELVDYRNFKEFYNHKKYKLTKEQKEYSFMNSLFVYKKSMDY